MSETMRLGLLRGLLALLAIMGFGTAVAVLVLPPLEADPPHERTTRAVATASGIDSEALDSIATRTIARTPFRAERRPAQVPYDPDAPGVDGGGAPMPPAPPRPTLAVSGIVWGAEPEAVIEGIPGAAGSQLMRRGQELGGVRVTGIRRDQVTLVGFDTTWTLEVRTTWQ